MNLQEGKLTEGAGAEKDQTEPPKEPQTCLYVGGGQRGEARKETVRANRERTKKEERAAMQKPAL